MINIKSIWFYSALAACLGGGFMGGVAVGPSQHDRQNAIQMAQQPDCEMTPAERAYFSAPVTNSPGKEY